MPKVEVYTSRFEGEKEIEITSLVDVTVVAPWGGSAMTAPSDLDYYGYEDAEVHWSKLPDGTKVELTSEEEASALDDAICQVCDE